MKKILKLILLMCYGSASYGQFIVHNTGTTVQTIEDIEVGTNGQIIAATDNGILINNNHTWSHLLPNVAVQSLEPYNGGFFFGSGKRFGTCNYTSVFLDTIASPAFKEITAIHVNNVGDTVLGTDDGLLFTYTTSGQFYLDSAYLNEKLGRVIDIQQLSGNVDFHVFATNDKTFIYDLDQNRTFILSTAAGALSNNFTSLYIDSSVLYLGVAGYGVSYTDFNDPNAITYYINKTNMPSLPSNNIAAIAVKDNNLYLGTDKGLAIRMNGKWKVYDKSNSNIPSDNIAELTLTKNGDIWIGTKDGYIASLSRDVVTGIQEASQQSVDVTLYPNPADDKITLQMNQSFSGNMAIYDMTGRVVISEEVSTGAQMDVHSLVSGIYLYRLTDNKGAFVKTGNLMVKH